MVFPEGTRAWVSLIMFLIQVIVRYIIPSFLPQFLVPLVVTVAAYSLISSHLWGTGHIGAATQQQQV